MNPNQPQPTPPPQQPVPQPGYPAQQMPQMTQPLQQPVAAQQPMPAQPVAAQPIQQYQPQSYTAVQPQAAYQRTAYTNAPNAQSAVQSALPQIPESPNSTQSTLLFSEIRDGLVIMKDGSFRAVVACKSINFDLMSEMEREGIEYSYQAFLNSLNFTTQILIRSQRVDIGPYLERLAEIRRNNDNMLLGVLMDDYINFVDILSQEANIMDKSFFIVIPYYTSDESEKALTQTKNIFGGLLGGSKTPQVTRIDRATYDKAVTEMNNRVEAIISGLFQIGIHSVRLNTKELSELYYNFNNPDTAVREPFIDFSKMATTFVRKGDSQNA